MLPPTKIERRVIEGINPNVMMLEQHYSVAEIAEKWKMSHSFVLERFQDEPGIVRSGKRGWIRIPESVLERVYRRMQSGGMR